MFSLVKTLPAVMLSALAVAPIALAQLGNAAPLQLRSSDAAPAPATHIEDELYRMSSQAGVIFAGQVLAVRRQFDLGYGSASGWVEIEFRVDQAVRGCAGQPTYTLREWSGLWSGGHQRYTVGERLLMLLYPPSASGLSSPVGGQDGAIPLTGNGASPRPLDRFVTSAEQGVDLRWVETRLLRTSPIASNPTTHPGSALLGPVYLNRARTPVAAGDAERAPRSNAIGTVRLAGNETTPAGFESTITVPLSGVASQGVTLRGVLAMFETWRAEQSDAAR